MGEQVQAQANPNLELPAWESHQSVKQVTASSPRGTFSTGKEEQFGNHRQCRGGTAFNNVPSVTATASMPVLVHTQTGTKAPRNCSGFLHSPGDPHGYSVRGGV